MSLPFLRVLVGELTLFSLFSISLFLIPQLKPRWLTFGGVSNRTLVGYCDVDWVSQPHCHSISGHSFQVGDRAVTWSLKKQQIIALLNTETEYVSLTHPRKEALWLWTLFREMWEMELTINCDNQGSITLTKDNKFHMKMKHIDVWYHFIWECIEDGKLKVKYIPTADNIPDIFTRHCLNQSLNILLKFWD